MAMRQFKGTTARLGTDEACATSWTSTEDNPTCQSDARQQHFHLHIRPPTNTAQPVNHNKHRSACQSQQTLLNLSTTNKHLSTCQSQQTPLNLPITANTSQPVNHNKHRSAYQPPTNTAQPVSHSKHRSTYQPPTNTSQPVNHSKHRSACQSQQTPLSLSITTNTAQPVNHSKHHSACQSQQSTDNVRHPTRHRTDHFREVLPTLIFQTIIIAERMSTAGERPMQKLQCGPMPNVMAALPNIGGTLFNAAKFG